MDVHAVNGGGPVTGRPGGVCGIMAAIHGLISQQRRAWHEAFNFVNDAATPKTEFTPCGRITASTT